MFGVGPVFIMVEGMAEMKKPEQAVLLQKITKYTRMTRKCYKQLCLVQVAPTHT